MRLMMVVSAIACLTFSSVAPSQAADPPKSAAVSEKDLPAAVQKELADLKKAVGNGEISSKVYASRRKAILEKAGVTPH